jgi:predicted metalloendopeptidase
MNVRRLIRVAWLIGAAVLLAPSVPYASAPAAFIPPHGFDLAYINRACKACDNFYQYAVGHYAMLHPIPGDKSEVISFEEIADRDRDQLHEILNAVQTDDPARTIVQKQVGDYFAACMDVAGIESAGLGPLDSTLAIVNGVKTKDDLAPVLAKLQLFGFNVYFNAYSNQDDKNPSAEILVLGQGGLGLPDRDYYLNPDASSRAIRDAYLAHVQKLFLMTGSDNATAAAAAASVMATETTLAKASSTNVQLRDPEANYHLVRIETLQGGAKSFDWNAFMTNLGVPAVTAVDVQQPAFFGGLYALLASASLSDIQTYLRWTVISQYGTFLPKAIDDEDFAFNAVLTGRKQAEPRWKRCVRETDTALGEALGQLYVAKAFSPRTRTEAVALVDNLQAVLRDDISSLSWMSADTRKRAVAKLDAYRKKIGYPGAWRKYDFVVSRSRPYENVLAATLFENRRELRRIGKPIDHSEWDMTPPTANAYYSFHDNSINFPAGILQPPLYDPNADAAYNYGGIGAIIGHEMTHGFDDRGSQYNAQGDLRNWWTASDRANFDSRARCVASYYDTLTVVPGVKQNGKLVEGEAIADLGGATIAYKAYMRYLNGKSQGTLDGFTPSQRFFLGFAQMWAVNARDESLRLWAKTDKHPAEFNRLNGTVANMPEFAAAWHCPMKAPMVRPVAQRCRIW